MSVAAAGPGAQAVADCLAALSCRIEGDVRADRYSRALYATDASIYQVMPLGVVLPRSADDVQATVETAAEHGLPLLPRAGGSSLAGQAVNEALVIDMSRHLDAVLEVDRAARRVRVQPGVVLDRLNERLRPDGLAFGPDPASSDRAGMGGVVSNNSTGAHSILYGMTADHVLGMDVVLADGSTARFGPLDADGLDWHRRRPGLEGAIYRRLAALAGDTRNRQVVRAGTPRHWRRCGGYNLDRLMDAGTSYRLPRSPGFNLAEIVCGAEGGLAVMTELTLGLVPVPGVTALALVPFDDLYRALSAVPGLLEAAPSAIELLDHLGLRLCRESREYARLLDGFLPGDPHCVLICELQGAGRAEVEAGVARLRRAAAAEGVDAGSVLPILEPSLQRDVWAVRKAALGLLMSLRGDRKPIPFIEDAAVPVEHLAGYVTRIERFCAGLGIDVAYYAHASAGCLHIRPLIDTKRAGEIARMPEILDFSVELLHGYGGSLSSEHGDGRARSWLNERFFGPELYRLYREVKDAFDPDGQLNPGAVVEAGPMTDNLRFGPDYRALDHPSRLDFTPDGGFDRAIEMCNGAAVCRRRGAGTMCPSFRVIPEEEQSTRGRANALRAAISGVLPAGELTSRRMYEVMELCVECKACKVECPSSVDMAKLKTEFLAGYRAASGVPLRDELFAHVGLLSRCLSGPLAPLANGVLGSAPARWLAQRLVGIDRRRPLPAIARESFVRWFELQPATRGAGGARVALLNDTFNTYWTPRVARAAAELLQTAGFEVVLPGHGCCGRPMLSKGLIDAARDAARATLDHLAPLAAAAVPIVGLEPSCVSAVRDDYAWLLPADDRVAAVARQTRSLEGFLVERSAAGTLDLAFTRREARVLLHGHCHQKALEGTAAARAALELVPGHTVEEIDSGCCGMAGSFGYETEHYDVSLAMAEDRLLPAVRAADSDTVLVASGISCRHQIEGTTGRRAVHPAELLRAAITPS